MKPTLIYCAGKNKQFVDLAHAAGFQIGAQVPCTVYRRPVFCDQDWKQPNRTAYMAALAQHRPALATVLDWERWEQLEEVLEWAEDAAPFVDQVAIIPKVVGGIPAIPRQIGGKDVVLAYSIPTRYGGSACDLTEFRGWDVHLLGGSPEMQIACWCVLSGKPLPAWLQTRKARRWYARYAMFLEPLANVISVDGNMHNAQAHRCRFWDVERGPKGHWRNLKDIGLGDWGWDSNRKAFELSCENIVRAWADCTISPV